MIPGRMKRDIGAGPMGIAPAGPSGPAMGPMDIGPPKQAGPGEPPNLRPAEEEMMSCGACKHFQEGACAQFGGFPVQPEQVCDAFEPMAEEGGAPPMPMMPMGGV